MCGCFAQLCVIHHVCAVTLEVREVVKSFGTEFQVVVSHHVVLVLNLGPLEEQPVLSHLSSPIAVLISLS